MDIQKLEQIVLTDVKADAENLLQKTKKESENWLLEQSNHIKEEHQEEIQRIITDHHSKLTIIKATLTADFHKNIGKVKKEKMEILKKEMKLIILEKVKNSPEWFFDQAFLGAPTKTGKILISEDLSSIILQENVEKYLKKYPLFSWGGYDKTMETGLSFECGSVRYLFPLQEMIDEFIETASDQIVDLLFP